MTEGIVFLIIIGALLVWFFVIGPIVVTIITVIAKWPTDESYWDKVCASFPVILVIIAVALALFVGAIMLYTIISRWNYPI